MAGNPRNHRRSSQRGAALIEFALVLPMLLAITFLVIDFTRAFYAQNLLHQSVREGARLLVVSNGADPQVQADVKDRVVTIAGGGPLAITPSAVQLTEPDADRMVSVTATGTFTWLYLGLLRSVGLGVGPTIDLTATCVMRDE